MFSVKVASAFACSGSGVKTDMTVTQDPSLLPEELQGLLELLKQHPLRGGEQYLHPLLIDEEGVRRILGPNMGLPITIEKVNQLVHYVAFDPMVGQTWQMLRLLGKEYGWGSFEERRAFFFDYIRAIVILMLVQSTDSLERVRTALHSGEGFRDVLVPINRETYEIGHPDLQAHFANSYPILIDVIHENRQADANLKGAERIMLDYWRKDAHKALLEFTQDVAVLALLVANDIYRRYFVDENSPLEVDETQVFYVHHPEEGKIRQCWAVGQQTFLCPIRPAQGGGMAHTSTLGPGVRLDRPTYERLLAPKADP